MARKLFAVLAVLGLGVMLWPLASDYVPFANLSGVSAAYAEQTPEQVGAANLVTAIIVTYRGLDTLGEVAVLFLATAGVGFLLRHSTPSRVGTDGNGGATGKSTGGDPAAGMQREIEGPSEILDTGGRFLIPLIVAFGVMIFLHGHVTPGGGFQGGVILASALLLYFLSREPSPAHHGLLALVESLSGGFYVVVGLLGLLLGAGFLDNRILPLGDLGDLLSAGAIPVIYSLVGLKVGAELSGILDGLRSEQGEHS